MTIQGFCLEGSDWKAISVEKAAAIYAGAIVNPKDDCVFFPNLLGNTPESKLASTLGNVPVTTHVAEVATVLMTRGNIGWKCRVALAKRLRDSRLFRSHLQYLMEQGFIKEKDVNNIVWVDDPLDYDTVLPAAEGKTLSPYMHNVSLSLMARRHNARLTSPDVELLEVSGRYGNKIVFREAIENLTGGRQFPRFAIGPGRTMSRRKVLVRLRRAVRFARECQKHLEAVGKLVIQLSDGAGGFGTLIVPWIGTFEGFDGEQVNSDLQSLRSWLMSLALDLEVDIAPCLPIVDSSSRGVVCRPEEIVVTGERVQILDEKLRFDGYRWNTSERPKDRAALCESDRELCEKFAKEIHKEGFHSEEGLCFGIDILYYVGPDGKIRSFFVEWNGIRRDGTSSTLVLFHQIPAWRELFLANSVSFEQHDHERIPLGLANSIRLRNYVADAGLPLATPESPYGITIPTPPHPVGDHAMGIVLFAARSDEERDRLVQEFSALMREFEQRSVCE